jgi:Protein of unknown function (DUF4435)
VREFLTEDRFANQLRLRRSIFLGTFLLVEGKFDRTFYERFVDRAVCQIEAVSGKPSSKLRAIAVLDILEKSSFLGVLGIVDADFDRLEASRHSSPNLLRTDTHDLETMLLDSPALDKLLAEFGSPEKITKFGDVRAALVAAGMSIGYLRWISQCNRLSLTFNDIKFSKFINEQSLQIDELKLIQEVKNKSQALALDNRELQQRLTNQKNDSHDPWQVCCGHDLVEILSLSLRKVIGTKKPTDVESDSLERALRLAYEEAYFRKTQLYAAIEQWECNNQAFRVLQFNS